jgi:ethanolamine ammonia-lyase small subunit
MSDSVPFSFPTDLAAVSKKDLRDYTYARIGLGKVGVGIPLKEVLAFRTAHAAAKDALFAPFETKEIEEKLGALGLQRITLYSEASDRTTYLQRPDLGRKLDPTSKYLLEVHATSQVVQPEVVIIVSEGLSAKAVNQHAVPLISLLQKKGNPAGWVLGPVVLLHKGRVAASDPIGEIMGAKLVLMLIGERPGLSSPDSMGAYLTYQPQVGLTDERRNCVSNIRPAGLPYAFAADKLFYLISESLRKKISGVGLKDEMGSLAIE